MTTTLSLAVLDEYIYTKIITFSHTFAFHNLTDLCLEIVQADCYESILYLNPNEYSPFHWPSASHPKIVELRLAPIQTGKQRVGSEWDWSSQFSLNGLGSIPVKCRHQQKEYNYMFLKVNIIEKEGKITVEVEKEKEEHPTYRIKNCSRNFSLAYWQENKHLDKNYLDVLSEQTFAWTDNTLPRIIRIQFYYGKLDESPILFKESDFKFHFDELGKTDKISIRLNKKIGHILYVSTLTDGYTKILEISDLQSECDMSNSIENQIPLFSYQLNVYSIV